MNKNKLIFAILGIILFVLIVLGITSLNKDKTTGSEKQSGDFVIWMIGSDVDSSRVVIENFKSLNTDYSSKNIVVENFSSFDDYYYALMSAVTSDKAPDIFMLNNNEKNSVFSNQVIGLDPLAINPNDFRKKYKGVFGDDLIIVTGDEENKQEFLIGVPVGYESLGIYYNRRYVKASELNSLSSLNNIIAELKDKKPNIVPIGIGNGSTVETVSDIVTQFFMLEDDVSSLTDVIGTKLKQGLASYLLYGDINGYNGYDSRFMELSNLGQNSVDLFSKGETFMIVGYPSLINQIKEKGFSKNFLQAAPFPHYYSGEGKTLVNYNYFVINKDSTEQQLANDFLGYLSTDIGASDYLSNFPYYLPALLSLEADKLEEKIHEDYNVVLKDFFSTDYELSSFDKGIKNLYDNNIVSILDNASNYETAFNRFRTTILCKTKKIVTLENLSGNCE